MSKQEIIEQTVQVLKQLPEKKAAEILDFAAFLLYREEPVPPTSDETSAEGTALTQQMAAYVETSPVFAFLHDPAEDVYTLDDLKVRYQ